ncbi:MAG: hypothetical protein HQL40_19000 [Alphaproteobacteria bacterium]|nr:hypothetical protein [Alphaproteobacteria bacterium]
MATRPISRGSDVFAILCDAFYSLPMDSLPCYLHHMKMQERSAMDDHTDPDTTRQDGLGSLATGEILTRREAADLMRVSTRQLDRLPIRKSYAAGLRSPRYLKEDLLEFIIAAASGQTTQPSNSRTDNRKLAKCKRAEWLRARLSALK